MVEVGGFNYESIGSWIRRRAELTPDRVAVDFEDQNVTYGDLNSRTNRAAAALTEHGVGRGDRVGVLSDNSPEYLEVFFACAKLAAIIVPVSWRLSQSEITWQFQDAATKLIVVGQDWQSAIKDPSAGEVLQFGEGSSYEAALAAAGDDEPVDNSTFQDPLMILYTSGTTGRPKGAVLTHGNFFWANLNMLVGADLRHDDVSLMFLPMFHIGGWNVNTLAVLWKGGTVVLERQFDPARTNDLIAKKAVTLLMGVPATYLFMSQEANFEQTDFSSVRTMVVGGAPMPEALLETYAARGIDIVQGYGLTELAPNALLLPREQTTRKLGSAGKPYFFTDTQLMDDDGNLLEHPSTGEIVARGPVVMDGYWQRDDATSDTIREGWLHTGDVGRTDEEGFFYVVDRKKDMIITGGENVYPAEVENVIYGHPAVGEVAVIGIPDEQWGESVVAIVVAKDGATLTEQQIIDHAQDRLAKFKVPRSVVLRNQPLPRTPAGKVRKPDLRAPYWEGRVKRI